MNKLLELAGAATLIVSLIFIGYEIRLANRIAQVETEWEMFNSYASYNELHIEKPELFIEKPIQEYTESDIVRKQAIFYRFLNVWLAAETAYSNGMISEATYLITLADAEDVLNRTKESGAISLWEPILAKYTFLADKEIIKFIAQKIES
jgi:hypothetical protein